PKLAALDVVADVAHALVAELAVAQPRHRVVFVESLQRLGGRFDVPLDQRSAQTLGNLEREHGLAGPGLAFDQQRASAGEGGMAGDFEVAAGEVRVVSFERHGWARVEKDQDRKKRAPFNRRARAPRGHRKNVSRIPAPEDGKIPYIARAPPRL